MSASIQSGTFARLRRPLAALGLFALAATLSPHAAAQTVLADQPVLTSPVVPGNLVLPLSVEYPTGVSVAHAGAYSTTRRLLGYFDPGKCYTYVYNADETQRYFQPAGTTTTRTCTGAGQWSGNFLNWATMQTIDPFRWALTGGNRVIDEAPPTTNPRTVIQKALHSGQGGTGNFPDRALTSGGLISDATPLAWNNLTFRIQGLGYRMRFSQQALDPLVCGEVRRGCTPDTQPQTGPLYSGAVTAYNPSNPPAANSTAVFELSVRVRVCDSATSSGGVESNCVLYGSNYKPEGLIQQYSDRIRYSAIGYLNDGDLNRDGGVLRARQKFVGPLAPRPGQSSIVNTVREWSATTGVMIASPDTADATAFGSAVPNSGVINYLNKFGQSGSYKGYDPVSELYYAALRYLKNQGNVPEWSNLNGGDAATLSDGFPVITDWGNNDSQTDRTLRRDPIQYSCQANFILGIGDVNTHADKNVPGPTGTANEPTKPGLVANDTTVDAVVQTNAVGTLEGMGNSLGTLDPFNGCCNDKSALMAGLAYYAHVRDIRPGIDLPGMQTVKTLWVDVLEGSVYKKNNQYYLAAKYGGFNVPSTFNPDTVTAATFPATSTWNANGQTLDVGNANSALSAGITVNNENWGGGANLRPDTYYTAGDPQSMVTGLTQAFSQIASDLNASTTAFAVPDSQVTPSGNVSYSASYTSSNWTGTLIANTLSFDANGVATQSPVWAAGTPPSGLTDRLANQLTGTGWDGSRRVISYVSAAGSTAPGVRFISGTGGISAAQLTLLDTPYGAGNDSAQYLSYLRGERCNEVGATTTLYPTCTNSSPLGYRARTALLGDISGSKVTAVAGPNSRYSDAVNPGYADFVTGQGTRPRMVYVGANDGMLHAFNGEVTGTPLGQEVFAYVPSALFNGPTSAAVDGLASRGNPSFQHRALVDSTPEVFDIDFARSNGAPVTTNPTAEWHSVLIGGLGKGGRSYYSIDVTSPQTVVGEAGWASRVLWEFPDAVRYPTTAMTAAVGQMGFSYGQPLVTKLAKYGWVVVLPSGYNSATGGTTRSYLFIVNPKTGQLLETITLGTAAQPSNGVAEVQAYRRDFADNTAESLYAGDLLGNIWRVDVRGTGTYDAPVNLAHLTTSDGTTAQPVTTRVLVEVDPTSGRRYVLVGTGRLLDATDIASTVPQSFYAILDGTRGAFATTLPTGFSFPITRGGLVENNQASLTGTGVTSTTTAPFGWYIDLGTDSSNGGRAWRVILDPITNAGRVSFGALLPDGGACASSNSSRRYETDFGTGRSVLLDANTTIAYTQQAGVIIDLRYLCQGTNCKAYAGLRGSDGTGSLSTQNTRGITLPGLRRLNWRELQVVQ